MTRSINQQGAIVTDTLHIDDTLDCSGLLCPLPVYKASIALKALEPGQVLKLVTTDPGALADIPALANQTSHKLLASEDSGTSQTFWLEKGV